MDVPYFKNLTMKNLGSRTCYTFHTALQRRTLNTLWLEYCLFHNLNKHCNTVYTFLLADFTMIFLIKTICIHIEHACFLTSVTKVRRVSFLHLPVACTRKITSVFTVVMAVWLMTQKPEHSFNPCTENFHHKHADGDKYYMSIKW